RVCKPDTRDCSVKPGSCNSPCTYSSWNAIPFASGHFAVLPVNLHSYDSLGSSHKGNCQGEFQRHYPLRECIGQGDSSLPAWSDKRNSHRTGHILGNCGAAAQSD